MCKTIPLDWPADYQSQFWKAYPNKKEKIYAMKALDKVAFAGKTAWIDLMEGLSRYILSREVKAGYVKHPATWLNKGCWMDEDTGAKAKSLSFFEIAAGHGD